MPEEQKKGVMDAAADALGAVFRGLGYGAGRVTPALEDGVKAIASTRPVAFASHHVHTGFVRGYNDTIRARAARLRRKERAQWFRDNIATPMDELADAMQEGWRGDDPRLKPEG